MESKLPLPFLQALQEYHQTTISFIGKTTIEFYKVMGSWPRQVAAKGDLKQTTHTFPFSNE